jgi:hypothetical protein
MKTKLHATSRLKKESANNEKWINAGFFIDLHHLLQKHIAPKSEMAAAEIENIVEAVCRSHHYIWSVKDKSDKVAAVQ